VDCREEQAGDDGSEKGNKQHVDACLQVKKAIPATLRRRSAKSELRYHARALLS
jgi:hypothetical protein